MSGGGAASHERELRRQEGLGWVASALIGSLYFLVLRLLGYRVRRLREIRRRWAELREEHAGPWIVCANHLTLIDSLVVTYALFSLTDHLRRFRAIPWNLPEERNFGNSRLLAALCYLAKCIPVQRGGDREDVRAVLDKCLWLLREGRSILIFPEGGRSRSGRVDPAQVSYGVGRLLSESPGARVLCLYVRGDGQHSYSDYPRFGERFTLRMEVLEPRAKGEGLRRQRAYAREIIETLARMEEETLGLCGERRCRPDGPGEPGEEPERALPRKGLPAGRTGIHSFVR
jgi:1-acyl-sn-glycerol-3-phosphate acyltransferase